MRLRVEIAMLQPLLILLLAACPASAFLVTPPARQLARRSSRCSSIRAADDVLLEVEGLKAKVINGQDILKGVNMKIKKGEVHAIMGPNGSGKSTFSKVIVGHPDYEVQSGSAEYKGEDILEEEPEVRAQQGISLGFQYPIEVPGVSNSDFLRLAVNKRRGAKGLDEFDPLEFLGVLSDKMETIFTGSALRDDFMSRDLNTGFSGGEKKRNEILQMVLLEPELAILDETDSGLDIDALKTVAAGVNSYKSADNGIVLITHYQRLLDYIKPDYVHVMYQGEIVRTGGPELALELEKDGYAFLGLDESLGEQV